MGSQGRSQRGSSSSENERSRRRKKDKKKRRRQSSSSSTSGRSESSSPPSRSSSSRRKKGDSKGKRRRRRSRSLSSPEYGERAKRRSHMRSRSRSRSRSNSKRKDRHSSSRDYITEFRRSPSPSPSRDRSHKRKEERSRDGESSSSSRSYGEVNNDRGSLRDKERLPVQVKEEATSLPPPPPPQSGIEAVEEARRWADALLSIGGEGFAPETFHSSRSQKASSQSFLSAPTITVIGNGASGSESQIHQDALLHPALFGEHESREERWAKRLAALRQRLLLNGDAASR